MLVANDAGAPTTKHITEETGMLFQPNAQSLAASIRRALDQAPTFRPREYVLARTGKTRSLARLRAALRARCAASGARYRFDDIDWDGRNQSLVWGEDAFALLVDVMTRHDIFVPPDAAERLFASV